MYCVSRFFFVSIRKEENDKPDGSLSAIYPYITHSYTLAWVLDFCSEANSYRGHPNVRADNSNHARILYIKHAPTHQPFGLHLSPFNTQVPISTKHSFRAHICVPCKNDVYIRNVQQPPTRILVSSCTKMNERTKRTINFWKLFLIYLGVVTPLEL